MSDQQWIALLGVAFVLGVCVLVYAVTTRERRLPRGRHHRRR